MSENPPIKTGSELINNKMCHLLSRTHKQIFGNEIYFQEEKKCLQWWGWGADCWHTDVRTRCLHQLCTKESYCNYQFSIFVLVIYQLDFSHWERFIMGTAALKTQEPELATVPNTHPGSHAVWGEKPCKGQVSALCVLRICGFPLPQLQIMLVHEEQVLEIKSRGSHYEFSPSKVIARISKITLLRKIAPTSPDDFLSWGCTGDTKSSCRHKPVFRRGQRSHSSCMQGSGCLCHIKG